MYQNPLYIPTYFYVSILCEHYPHLGILTDRILFQETKKGSKSKKRCIFDNDIHSNPIRYTFTMLYNKLDLEINDNNNNDKFYLITSNIENIHNLIHSLHAGRKDVHA